MEEAKVELAKALVKFQSEMPVVKRTATGQAGSRKYKYADLPTVQETAKPHLKSAGLAVNQPLDTNDDGVTFIITEIWHESGQVKRDKLRIPLEGLKPQEVGSVITYYRRYAYTANLGIAVEGEDDDADSAEAAVQPVARDRAQPRASATNPPSEKQIGLIAILAERKGKDDEWIRSTLAKVKTSADASTVIDKLQELEDA